MVNAESPAAIAAQGAVAVALIGATAFLAYLDPAARGMLEGVMTGAIGVVIGYFFSQRSTAGGVHAATNGMSTMAGLIARAVPGPAGEAGPPGEAGPAGAPGRAT